MLIKDVISGIVKGIWGEEPKETDITTPVIKTNNMSYEGYINYDNITLRTISPNKLASSFLHYGDLLVEKSGGTKTHSVGYVNIFESESNKFVCNNFILGLRPKSEIVLPKFLFFQLKYLYEIGMFSDCYNKTTGIQNLKTDTYISKPIICPDKITQNRIVAELDKIQGAIDNKRQQLAKLDELVNSKFYEMFGDPIANPKDWGTKKIGEFAQCIAGATPSTKKNEYWENGDIPWLSSGEVSKGRIYDTEKKITQLGYDNSSTKLIPPHSVLIALAGQGKTRGTVGIAEIQLCTNQSICSIINPSEIICVNFLYYYLKSKYDELRAISNGDGGRGGLNLKLISNFKVLIPPLELQEQFANFAQKIEQAKDVVSKQIDYLQELLDSRMDFYFRQ